MCNCPGSPAQDISVYDFPIACGRMHTIETTDPKEARRFRYAQHRGTQTTLTFRGATITGLVHSVMEDRSMEEGSGDPKRWIVRIMEKQSGAMLSPPRPFGPARR